MIFPESASAAGVTVAVGILRDAAGRVLIARRPPGKPFAGQWEFPGGKIDGEETARQALARELEEELGIVVGGQRPLIAFTHRYDDLRVRLHVHEVLDYRGTPVGLEGQALDWVAPAALPGTGMLAANAVIAGAIRLPRLCLISDTRRFGVAPTLARLAGHVAARRVLLIVREKTLHASELRDFVARARDIVRPSGSLVLVHADCRRENELAADGTHWPARALAQEAALRPDGLAGVSCHNTGELHAAWRRGVDYALLSPVQRTASHPDAQPLGWPRFAALVRDLPLPVYALGGLSLADLDRAADAGAQGIALLGGAWE